MSTCANLIVTSQAPNVTLVAGGETYGELVAASPTSIEYIQGLDRGPDVRVEFYKEGVVISVMEFQQDYCYLAAGAITVNVISGATPIYNPAPGSFPNIPGQVFILSF